MTGGDVEARVTSNHYFKEFAETIRKIKMIENIKSNGTALTRMIELAKMKMDEIRQE